MSHANETLPCKSKGPFYLGRINIMVTGDLATQGARASTAMLLTHWGRVTHICVSELTIIGSDNGLSPDRRQAIIWTNAGILSIGPLRTNFSEILIETLAFSSKKMRLKVSSAKWRQFCLGLNELTGITAAQKGHPIFFPTSYAISCG